MVVPCFLEHDRLDGYFGDALEEELAVWGETREGAGIEGGKREGMRERRMICEAHFPSHVLLCLRGSQTLKSHDRLAPSLPPSLPSLHPHLNRNGVHLSSAGWVNKIGQVSKASGSTAGA